MRARRHLAGAFALILLSPVYAQFWGRAEENAAKPLGSGSWGTEIFRNQRVIGKILLASHIQV